MALEIRRPINEHEWNAYYSLRYEVLRAPLGQPLGSERNEGDATGIHFALYEDEILKAIARLDLQDQQIAQVRFVAVDQECQGKGFGLKIMQATEVKAKELGIQKMILHARDYAVEFYIKQGYQNLGASYKLFDVLQHYLMEKNL